MSKRNGKSPEELICVTIKGKEKLMTLKQLDKQTKAFSDRDFKRMRKEGKKLFRTDQEFDDFLKNLREIRQGV